MLTAETLRALLDYDPETGVFTWRVDRGRKAKAGQRAGYLLRGYLRIKIHGKAYPAHNLAWLHVHGVWPTIELDHEDTDKSNNRLSNLREATRNQNVWNRRTFRNNTSGFKGVSFTTSSNKWRAEIDCFGQRHFLGYFSTPEKAHEAYVAASKRLHGEFARSE